MARCVVCGRDLRTGRKYCWKHRNTKKEDEPEADSFFIWVFLAIIFFVSLFLLTLFSFGRFILWSLVGISVVIAVVLIVKLFKEFIRMHKRLILKSKTR